MSQTRLDLGLGVLDHQLVDSDGHNCGKVDDLELTGLDGNAPEVIEILVGGNAWRSRGRLGRLAARVSGNAVHVPWPEVDDVSSVVSLKRPAAELRLSRGDDRAARLVEQAPGILMRLSSSSTEKSSPSPAGRSATSTTSAAKSSGTASP